MASPANIITKEMDGTQEKDANPASDGTTKRRDRVPADSPTADLIREALKVHSESLWQAEGLKLNNLGNKNVKPIYRTTWQSDTNHFFSLCARLARRIQGA